MAWTKYQLFLAGLMLVTGSINTLSAKWADNFVAPGCGGSQEHSFQHPFLQAVGMFLGEFSCLAAFYLLRCRAAGHPDTSADPQQPFNPLLFLPPALCDMTGTSIMYVALNMTSASSFQMLRGAVIIFTGLFSVTFLGRRLALSQWLGILATIAGLVVVGLADLLSKHDSQHKLSEVITGVAGVGIPGLPCTESLDKAFYRLCCPPSPGGGHVGHQLMWTCTCSRATQTAGSGRRKECTLTEHLPSAQACFAPCSSSLPSSQSRKGSTAARFTVKWPPWSRVAGLNQKCPSQSLLLLKRPAYPSCAALRPRQTPGPSGALAQSG
ncbi:solute carrier family 35 member F6 isoform X3 [Balaenoptera musculus]|uniref:Solute carrier family 35 member F6 isoform X3 n=1 Tax=Balaenoptera musculus TaxID=9771 RepID=A0A8B8Z554_BALMU|nr:solute carrier family 35 member F6 isoform X3 [Balaenoptera musculus]